jgi:RecJ-like exonuclease
MMTCALCGNRFEREEALCSGCPINKSCKIICCPNCGYQTVDDEKIRKGFKWLTNKILKKIS